MLVRDGPIAPGAVKKGRVSRRKRPFRSLIEAKNVPFEGLSSSVKGKRSGWENLAKKCVERGERRCVLRCSRGVYQGAKCLLADAFHFAINPHKIEDRHASKRFGMRVRRILLIRTFRRGLEANFARGLTASLGRLAL